jgi:hypothetical protein
MRVRFNVDTILMDSKCEEVKDELLLVVCSTTAAKSTLARSNIPFARSRRHKDNHRNSPFECIPQRLKMEFIYFVVLWLNAFPVKMGISAIYSPRERVVRWRLDYKKHCRVLPGKYCKAHVESLPSNTTTTRTHECIACGPTGNLQGSVKFYCLKA